MVCLVQVKLMTDSLRSAEFSSYSKVPDPYYGGTKGFDLVSAPARPASDVLEGFACWRVLPHCSMGDQCCIRSSTPRRAISLRCRVLAFERHAFVQVLDLLEDACAGLLADIEG